MRVRFELNDTVIIVNININDPYLNNRRLDYTALRATTLTERKIKIYENRCYFLST